MNELKRKAITTNIDMGSGKITTTLPESKLRRLPFNPKLTEFEWQSLILDQLADGYTMMFTEGNNLVFGFVGLDIIIEAFIDTPEGDDDD